MTAAGDECVRCGAPHATPRPHAETICYLCAIRSWTEQETRFAEHDYTGSDPAGTVTETHGRPELWFTAASAVNTHRRGQAMLAGRNTGGLAAALAATTGFSALAQSGTPDPRPDHVGPTPEFATALAARVPAHAFVIDIRGMRDRNVDVCIGMGPAPTARTEFVAAALERSLTGRGLRVNRNAPFTGDTPWSVTGHWHRAHPGAGNALQLGVSAWLRSPQESASAATLLLSRLTIATLNLEISPTR